MIPDDVLQEILGRLGATHGETIFLSTLELDQWPEGTVAILQNAGLLKQSRPAISTICRGCERECPMSVNVRTQNGAVSAFIVCDKRTDINRVTVSPDSLEQWQTSGTAIADVLARLLEMSRASIQDTQARSWEIGMLKGAKHKAHVALLAGKELVLRLAGRQVPLTNLLEFRDRQLAIDVSDLKQLVDISNTDVHDLASPDKHWHGREQQDRSSDIGSPDWRTDVARKAANARHDRPGGSREKQRQIREIWATGKFSSRDRCAEEECAALGMSYSSARKALINTPDP